MIASRRHAPSPLALAALLASGLALAGDHLLRVELEGAEEVITEAEGRRRFALLSPGQRHALGSTAEAQHKAFVSMLTEEALLAVAGKKAELSKTFAVAEVQRRVLARAVIDRAGEALGPASAIPDAEVMAYYEGHRSTYEAPARVQLWRILCGTEAKAKEVLAKAKKGISVQDWMALARETSIDEATKLRGGNLGFLDEKGISDDAPVSVEASVVAAAAGVAEGIIVDAVVPEKGNFAVVWRRSSLPAVRRSVEEVAPQIRGALWREKRDKLEDEAVKAIVAARATLRDDDALTVIDANVLKNYEEKRKKVP
jgi:peptidyl-prolyl cis-trans isomerase C